VPSHSSGSDGTSLGIETGLHIDLELTLASEEGHKSPTIQLRFDDHRRSSVIAEELCMLHAPTLDSGRCVQKFREVVKKGRRSLYHLAVNRVLEQRFLDAGLLGPSSHMEGHLGQYAEKQDLILEIVDRTDVQRICEVGFNAGHSAMLFLAFNEDVSLVSFDLGHHNYSWVAANTMLELFPKRHLLIIGDSARTLPSFTRAFPDVRCDVLLVDGGHAFDEAERDLQNGRQLVKRESHILVVDDTNGEDVRAAWQAVITNGNAVEDYEFEASWNVCWVLQDKVGIQGDGTVVVERKCETPSDQVLVPGRSKMSVGRYQWP